MSAVSVLLVKQTTSTAGTGSYSLVAPTGNTRAFSAAFSTGNRVAYVARDASNYEIAIGTLTTGATDTISRLGADVIASSNAGALVNWAPGVRDIYALAQPGLIEPLQASGAYAVGLLDWGAVIEFTGSTAAAWTLPALTSAPPGFSVYLANRGNADVTVTPSGSDTIGTLATLSLTPGDSVTLIVGASSWMPLYTSEMKAGVDPDRMPSASMLSSGAFREVMDTTGAGIAGELVALSAAGALPSGIRILPAGLILPYGGSTAPSGWYECDGTTRSRTTDADLFAAIGTNYGAGDGSTTFTLPDFRGEFIRGWDHGRGADPDAASRTGGDTVGSTQSGEIAAHTHGVAASGTPTTVQGGAGAAGGSSVGGTSGSTGGNETRPRNVAAMFIIKR